MSRFCPKLKPRYEPVQDSRLKVDGTSRPRDRNEDSKKLLVRKSEVVQEMSFAEINFCEEDEEETHYMVTGDSEPPNPVPEFLNGRIPSRTVLNQFNCDHNDSLDATLPAAEQAPPMVATQDPNHRLADVLTSL